MVKEQALRTKVTERGWQEEKCNVILAISISIEEWSDLNHLLGAQSGAVLRRKILLLGYSVSLYRTRSESSLDSEGTGSKSPGCCCCC